jgi:hypothetical protein
MARGGNEPEISIPVTCRVCGLNSMVAFPAVVVGVALTRWHHMQLRSDCHDVSWDASDAEIMAIRGYLGEAWISARKSTAG